MNISHQLCSSWMKFQRPLGTLAFEMVSTATLAAVTLNCTPPSLPPSQGTPTPQEIPYELVVEWEIEFDIYPVKDAVELPDQTIMVLWEHGDEGGSQYPAISIVDFDGTSSLTTIYSDLNLGAMDSLIYPGGAFVYASGSAKASGSSPAGLLISKLSLDSTLTDSEVVPIDSATSTRVTGLELWNSEGRLLTHGYRFNEMGTDDFDSTDSFYVVFDQNLTTHWKATINHPCRNEIHTSSQSATAVYLLEQVTCRTNDIYIYSTIIHKLDYIFESNVILNRLDFISENSTLHNAETLDVLGWDPSGDWVYTLSKIDITSQTYIDESYESYRPRSPKLYPYTSESYLVISSRPSGQTYEGVFSEITRHGEHLWSIPVNLTRPHLIYDSKLLSDGSYLLLGGYDGGYGGDDIGLLAKVRLQAM